MTTANVDTDIARAYEKHMVPAILGPWARRVVGLANIRPDEHVLDVACGTGIGARLAAARAGSSGRVVGVDIDPGMIAVAGTLARQSAVPIEWHLASALEMPFTGSTFDLCLCLHGVQFLPDRTAGFAEMRRVLKPSGRALASIWGPLETTAAHSALFTALERQNIDTEAASRGYSFGDPEQIREAALAAGFRTVEIRTEERRVGFPSVQAFMDGAAAGSPAAGSALRKLPGSARAQVLKDMTDLLGPYVTGARFAWPMRAHIVFARP